VEPEAAPQVDAAGRGSAPSGSPWDQLSTRRAPEGPSAQGATGGPGRASPGPLPRGSGGTRSEDCGSNATASKVKVEIWPTGRTHTDRVDSSGAGEARTDSVDTIGLPTAHRVRFLNARRVCQGPFVVGLIHEEAHGRGTGRHHRSAVLLADEYQCKDLNVNRRHPIRSPQESGAVAHGWRTNANEPIRPAARPNALATSRQNPHRGKSRPKGSCSRLLGKVEGHEWPDVQCAEPQPLNWQALQFASNTAGSGLGEPSSAGGAGAGTRARASPIVFLRCRNGVAAYFRCGASATRHGALERGREPVLGPLWAVI